MFPLPFPISVPISFLNSGSVTAFERETFMTSHHRAHGSVLVPFQPIGAISKYCPQDWGVGGGANFSIGHLGFHLS